jgi:hypothetical protein
MCAEESGAQDDIYWEEVATMTHVAHSSAGFKRDRYDLKRDSKAEHPNADRGTDAKDTSAGTRDK